MGHCVAVREGGVRKSHPCGARQRGEGAAGAGAPPRGVSPASQIGGLRKQEAVCDPRVAQAPLWDALARRTGLARRQQRAGNAIAGHFCHDVRPPPGSGFRDQTRG